MHDYVNPQKQIPKYNFDKVTFKQRDFSIHPINSLQDVNCIWGYEHYNPKNINHHRNTSNLPQIVHNNYYYSFDNITNRYLGK